MRFIALLFSLSLLAGPTVESITPANVARLKIVWTYDTGEAIDHFRRDPRFEATPVYDDGKLYVSTPGGLWSRLTPKRGRKSGKPICTCRVTGITAILPIGASPWAAIRFLPVRPMPD